MKCLGRLFRKHRRPLDHCSEMELVAEEGDPAVWLCPRLLRKHRAHWSTGERTSGIAEHKEHWPHDQTEPWCKSRLHESPGITPSRYVTNSPLKTNKKHRPLPTTPHPNPPPMSPRNLRTNR